MPLSVVTGRCHPQPQLPSVSTQEEWLGVRMRDWEWSPGLLRAEQGLSRRVSHSLPFRLPLSTLKIHVLRISDLATLKPACWRDHGSEVPQNVPQTGGERALAHLQVNPAPASLAETSCLA